MKIIVQVVFYSNHCFAIAFITLLQFSFAQKYIKRDNGSVKHKRRMKYLQENTIVKSA